jgi:hypothetical protein
LSRSGGWASTEGPLKSASDCCSSNARTYYSNNRTTLLLLLPLWLFLANLVALLLLLCVQVVL